ncbi:MAG: AIPR family protein [Pseudomonadota bacterium]
MHLVTQANLREYGKQYESTLAEPVLFEAFINYVTVRQFTPDVMEPDDLIFAGDDPGIDGVMIVVGDAVISTVDELKEAFQARQREQEVEVIFTQAKTGDRWVKQEINNFTAGVADFLSSSPKFPMSEKLKERRDVFFESFNYIGKVVDGRPRAKAYFATSAATSNDTEILAARDALARVLQETDYFSECESILLDRNRVNELWRSSGGSVEASITTIGLAPFPAAPGIEASYVATVSAKDFVDRVLADADGKLRQRIFDENVRDYIGDDNDVNEEISATISDPEKQKRFGVMNNGVTIVSPDVRVQGVEIFMRDFQIINGCQTSNVLFSNSDKIGSDANLMIKVVHAQDTGFVEDIVRSTNRQSKVQDDQFLATIQSLKNIERYFEARDDGDQRLYFERRKNQYAGRGVPAIRIFDVKHLARCVGAMFIERPDLASRYPNRLTGELKESVFNPKYKDEIFYTAANAYYRIFLHFSNQRLDPRFSNLKWHLMMAVKVYLEEKEIKLESNKAPAFCKKIDQLLNSNSEADVTFLNNLCVEISGGDQLNRDQLRSQSLLATMKVSASAMRG